MSFTSDHDEAGDPHKATLITFTWPSTFWFPGRVECYNKKDTSGTNLRLSNPTIYDGYNGNG